MKTRELRKKERGKRGARGGTILKTQGIEEARERKDWERATRARRGRAEVVIPGHAVFYRGRYAEVNKKALNGPLRELKGEIGDWTESRACEHSGGW